MQIGFLACAEDFKPGGFKIFLKNILVSKPKFHEEILKRSEIYRSKITPAFGNNSPLNFRKVVAGENYFW